MAKEKSYFQTIIEIFNKFSLQQRILVIGSFALTLILLILFIFIFNEPNYSTLYTNLAVEDAAKVVDYLNNQKIPYKLENDGQTVKVPKEKVYETRLELASKGIPNSGIIGYEIFDNNTMGMSDYIQKLNFKRALEGELTRTIMQQQGVEAARVHIVFPEKAIFKDEMKPPTASVVLKLNNNYELTQNNIMAISHLVANSIEGLTPEHVTIVDTKGRLLSQREEDNGFGVFTAKQYEIKNKVESYLADKAQTMLDNVLGFGNSMVKVNLDLDFNQVEKTMENYDPESQVAISEQTTKSENGGKSISDSSQTTNESTITNYEVNKSIERIVSGIGNIKRMTVAAVINDMPKEVKKGNKTETVNEPRSQDQLQKLEEIVRQSVGIDGTRNDQISIVSIPFENQNLELNEKEILPSDQFDKWQNIIILSVAFIGALFVLRSLMKKLKNEKIIIGTINPAQMSTENLAFETASTSLGNVQQKTISRKPKRQLIEVGDIDDEISDEAVQKKMKQDKIVNYVAKNPSEAAKLINLWLRENEFD